MPGRLRRLAGAVTSIRPSHGRPPQARRRAVAESRIVTAGEHRGQPASLRRQPRMPDRVDSAMDHTEATNLHAVGDRVFGEPEVEQLLARDDPVMPPHQRRDAIVDRTLSTLTATIAVAV